MVEFPVVRLIQARRGADIVPVDYGTIESLVMAKDDKDLEEFAGAWHYTPFYSSDMDVNTLVTYHPSGYWTSRYNLEPHPYSGLLPDRDADPLDIYRDVKAVITFALDLRAIFQAPSNSLEDFTSLGFEYNWFEKDGSDHVGPEEDKPKKGDIVQLANLYIPLHSSDYTAYLDQGAGDPNSPLSDCDLTDVEILINKDANCMVDDWWVNHVRGAMGDDAAIAALRVSSGSHLNTLEGRRKMAGQVLDELITLHLFDVRTTTINGGTEYRQAGSMLSSIWCCMVDSFSKGRTDRCKVCGKPFVAFGERGKKRLYCSGACNKWAQRNPGKTR